MVTTPNLGITHVEESDDKKEVPMNAGLDRLDRSTNDPIDINTDAGGSIVVAAADFLDNYHFRFTGDGNSAGFTIIFPDGNRAFTVENATSPAQTATLETDSGSAVNPTVAGGESAAIVEHGIELVLISSTTTPGGFADGTEGAPSIFNVGDIDTGIWFPTVDVIAISVGGAEALRIDSGDLFIGHDTDLLTGGGRKLQVSGGGTGTGLALARFSTTDSAQAVLDFIKSSDTDIGDPGLVVDNEALGKINWRPSDSVDFGTIAVSMEAEVDDPSPANDSIGGAWILRTAQGLASDDLTLAIQVDNAQNVLIGGGVTPASAFGCLAIKNAPTKPSAGLANNVVLYSVDLSAGNTILGIRSEGDPEAASSVTIDRTIAIEINGTVRYLMVSDTAT